MKKLSSDQNLKIKQIFASASENHLKNNFEIAQNLYQDILKINPYHTETLYNLGLVFQNLENLIKQRVFIKKQFKLNPIM